MPDTSAMLRLPDTPSFPLASGVALPAGHRFAPTAVLSLRLGDMTLTAQGGPVPTAQAGREGACAWALPPLLLHGRYSLDVRPELENPVDSGGSLMPLGQAPPSPGDPLFLNLDDATREQHLAAARKERTRLIAESPNGFRLVSTYYRFNEHYNTAFTSGYMNGWERGGVTAQMAVDTADAMGDDTKVVNKPDVIKKVDGKDVTYNENAFTQHNTLKTAMLHLAKAAKKKNDPVAEQEYMDASAASDEFATRVKDRTGNDKKQITPRTAPEIRKAVREAPADGKRRVSVADPDVYLDPDRYLDRVEREGSGALPPGMDREDLRHIQRVRAAIIAADAARLALVGEAYHQGTFQAVVEGATATATTGDDGPPVWIDVHVPEPVLDFDDSGWQGEVAAAARARIASMRFIAVLLRESIRERVAAAARTAHPSFAPPSTRGGRQEEDE
ncbi:hypothetical protein ACIQI7_22445 [Kitasatospora sp. NPDC092039]|uniref:hypothetical protein n=1 Tax=Kitasatospora sp. NPDC092039 TaxID=3364086 RepID=UPI0038128213